MNYPKIYSVVKRYVSDVSGRDYSDVLAEHPLSRYFPSQHSRFAIASGLNTRFADTGHPVPGGGLAGNDTATLPTVQSLASHIADKFGV